MHFLMIILWDYGDDCSPGVLKPQIIIIITVIIIQSIQYSLLNCICISVNSARNSVFDLAAGYDEFCDNSFVYADIFLTR